MPVQTQLQTRRGTAASWTSTNPTLAAGEFGYETDTGKFKIGNGSTAWASLAYTAAATAVTYLFNATSGQTTFSGADANGLTLAYTVGAEQVYLNGVLQVRGSDYTGTNGTSIVLTSGALTSDVLNVIAYSAMTVTDTYTQAQADAKFFQTANAFLAGKNKIINGDFGINQRAFTSVTATSTFFYDRWQTAITGDGTATFTPQTFTPGTAPVSGYEGKNYLRIVTASQTTTAVRTNFIQRIEDVRTFAGQNVTYSFWAKATTGTPSLAINFSQNFGSGGSAQADGTSQKVTLSTSWARYSITYAMPSVSGKTIGDSSYTVARIWVSAGSDFNASTDTLGIQNNTFEFWGLQLEAGSIATPFQTATGTLAGELAACQRYYYRTNFTGGNYQATGLGSTLTTSILDVPLVLKNTMRIAPTVLDISTVTAYTSANGAFTGGTFTINLSNTDLAVIRYTHGSAVFTNNTLGWFYSATSGFIGVSAEL
jgi:hypothetical protein